ncbi:MAG: phosphoribosylformylglycinamidine synthase subunit PurL [Candidatus Marinimicrobia bacterium]|nr:phosphoribosylformylglycinamidine synthase subunit PurL [Candidatus Neomarinimicrobiota bacterium]
MSETRAATEPVVDEQLALEHGLSQAEYGRIQEILGRQPTFTELGIFSVMWSEHCSYKSSIKVLKTLPRSGARLLVEAGEENAGLVDIGGGRAIAFKIESHNHPSAVEPYQGAATGVGGIMRDIFTMGARPIAALNSLRFGDLDDPHNRYLLEQVVRGIGDYGNCLGVPTVGGELVIAKAYKGNPLINAMAVGIVQHDRVVSAVARGKGNPVFIIGSKTGRDGIHGATFASEELSEESESRKSNVQVGDPFTEKLLLEATLELARRPFLVGMQDMGAAGITCSCSEMAAKGKSGLRLDLDKVPLREPGMTPYEIMLSESQERMLVVIKAGFEQELLEIAERWELGCTRVGEVTDSGNLEVYSAGDKVADVPCQQLVLGGGAPQYTLPAKRPAYLDAVTELDINSLPEPENYNHCLLKLLSGPNIAHKGFIYEQYDSTVRSNTAVGPGADAAVIRIKGTNQALALSTDGNGRYTWLDPRIGGRIAVAEAARNVVCAGAQPVAITNCLNFGNPNDPEIYFQFQEAVAGIGEACRYLNTPVTGGNVSFYNESPEGAVYPTPVVGMLGLIEDLAHITRPAFRQEGDFIVVLGSLNGELGGSEYLERIHGLVQGSPPPLTLDTELRVQVACLEGIRRGIIRSAHDVSDGGLAVCLVESLLDSPPGLGADIHLSRRLRNDELLFGESQSVIVVTVTEDQLLPLQRIAMEEQVPSITIGRVTDQARMKINDLIDLPREQLEEAYRESFGRIMKVPRKVSPTS